MKEDFKSFVYNLGQKIGELTSNVENLETHFTNHLHSHWIDRVINIAMFALVVIMFCFLKWGT